MACRNKLSRLKFLKSINRLFLVTLIAAILIVALLVLSFLIKNRFSDVDSSANSFKIILDCLIILLPIGLFVLCIIASIIFRHKLSKQYVRVQNLSCLESFTNIDVLCVDKSGALTDGNLEIKKVIPLKAIATEEYLAQWISNVLSATNGQDLISNALRAKYDFELSAGVVSVLPFGGGRQYFGASFKGGKNLIIGNPKYISLKNEVGILKRCEEYINNGYRIFVLAEGKEQVAEDDYVGELDAIALIVLKEHIRDDAFETFKWFKENGADIRVISSKDPLVTSVIAAEVGIENADKYVSLEGMSIEKVKSIADSYIVFGKASQEQKEALIESFKQGNKKVTMMGDDNSELQAMRKADCAISIEGGDDEAINTADIVITSSSLKPLINARSEASIFINNLRKITSLHLARVLFGFVLVFTFMIISLFKNEGSIYSPFTFNNFLICDLLINTVAGLFLFFKKDKFYNNEPFIKSILKKAIPVSVLMFMSVAAIIVIYFLQTNNLLNLGVYSIGTITTMSFLTINILDLAYFYAICKPLNKYRKILLIVISSIMVLSIFVDILVTYLTNKTGVILEVPYLEMNGPAYMSTAIIVIVFVAIYIFIHELISIIKGDNNKNEN